MALTLSPNWPSRETSVTSLLWESTSVEKELCPWGERMERCEMRELMLRIIGCNSFGLLGSPFAAADESEAEMLET
jgi:hypothetical protein